MTALLKIVVAGFLIALAGCSNFEHRWRDPLPIDRAASPILGKWDGTWFSNGGHGSGDLRAIIVDSTIYQDHALGQKIAPRNISATFKSTFWAIFHTTYTVDISIAETKDGRCTFRGVKDLGPLAGGTYSYEGSATATDLLASYTSKYDHGNFNLQNVP